MTNEKIKPKGITTFQKHPNQPDFVKGKMIISLNAFFEWAKTVEEHYKEYTDKNGETHNQLHFEVLEGQYGINFQLDTFKGGETKTQVVKEENDLPF